MDGDTIMAEKPKAATDEARAIFNVRAILFDWDGTLADTIELILCTFEETFRVLGIPPRGRDDILSQVGRPLVEQARDIDPTRAEEIFSTYQRLYEKNHPRLAREFPGIREALKSLKERGYLMALVTSKRADGARHDLSHFGYEGFFEAVVTADDTVRHKPHPEPALEALRRLGSSPEEATFIGDSPFDIRCAHAAGMTAGAVEWGPFPRRALETEGPDYWVREPACLLELFRGPEGAV